MAPYEVQFAFMMKLKLSDINLVIDVDFFDKQYIISSFLLLKSFIDRLWIDSLFVVCRMLLCFCEGFLVYMKGTALRA